MKEARWYKKLSNNKLQCQLCPNFCIIAENKLGKCNVRKNIEGRLISLVYNKAVATAVDPIEKKPLYHFLPGSKAYSIGTVGCNFKCKFCQNWELSRSKSVTLHSLLPEEVVQAAMKNRCRSIAYTYNDPIVFIEYVIDIAKIAKSNSIRSVFVSNGYINPEPLKELCKYIDAAAIDLKGFTEKFYKEFCNGKLKPVLESLKIMKEQGVWIELINLIIPTLNDDMKTIARMCRWIKDNLGEETVLHFSRFFPHHKLQNIEPTPEKTLENARKEAVKAGLKYVYVGNIAASNHTYCPKCGKMLIERYIGISENNIRDKTCRYCSREIAGVF